MNTPPDLARLLENTSWLRGLARSLVVDERRADDLVQEAFLAAVRRPPRNPGALPAWLSAVVRRLALRGRRDEGRRRRREERAARLELVLGGAEKLVERAESHRRLIDEVLRLDEPFRSTVLRRYFDEKSHAEIAAAEGIPASTVRWRLAEGLRRLRARLDRLHGGDRTAWLASLAPLTGGPGLRDALPVFPTAGSSPSNGVVAAGSQSFLLGGAMMTTKSVAAWVGACLLALAIGLGIGRGSAPGGGGEAERAHVAERPQEGGSAARNDLVEIRTAFASEKAALVARIAALEAELAVARRPPEPAPDDTEEGATAKEREMLEEAARDLILQRLDPEYLWKAAHESGDLDAMERYLELAEAIYRLRLAQLDLPEEGRQRLEQSMDSLGFRKGYTRLARGEDARAREDLRAHIESIDLKEKELAAAGGSLPPASSVYGQRSRDVLEAIEELIGRPPPVQVDLGELWATAKRASLVGLREKAVGIVFRRPNDQRSADFLGPLSRMCEGDPGIELVTISSFAGSQSADEQVSGLRQELERIGFKGAVGFDPDAVGRSLFRRFKATVGSATFYVLNPAGKVVWFMQDPRGADALFAKKLLDRAAGR